MQVKARRITIEFHHNVKGSTLPQLFPQELTQQTRQHFQRQAAHYEQTAVVQQTIAKRLLARLCYLRMQPERVVDLGCGTGFVSAGLLQRYKKAHVISMDSAPAMLTYTRRQGGWWRKPTVIAADATQLPLQDQSIDMVLSNVMLPYCADWAAVFAEVMRVLRPEGVFMFTALGPDSLQEWRQSWQQGAGASTDMAHYLRDMHDMGDELLAAGFRDPVMDREVLTLTYRHWSDLLRELRHSGVRAMARHAPIKPLTRQTVKAVQHAYAQQRQADGLYPLSLEVVYGQAWAPIIQSQGKPARYIPIQSR